MHLNSITIVKIKSTRTMMVKMSSVNLKVLTWYLVPIVVSLYSSDKVTEESLGIS